MRVVGSRWRAEARSGLSPKILSGENWPRLRREGWRVWHSLRWPGGGDIVQLLCVKQQFADTLAGSLLAEAAAFRGFVEREVGW